MIIIPAIDLLDGKCVRLYQGDYSKSTVYPRDPVETARSFVEAGAQRIHIVDLNAARGDGSSNRETIRKIRTAVPVTLEVGGGIRREEDVRELADMGIDRLIVGTSLVQDPESVRRWAREYPGKIVAGIDARGAMVRVSGWEMGSQLSDTDAALAAAEAEAVEIIYTNIDKDGTLEGPDIERSVLMARTSGLPVIVSGGVRGREDFSAAAEREAEGIVGIIAGKALYEGAFDLPSAIKEFS
ncbi:MAG: 1-(5-phosphoribosyl)-5-[(5-phosphoribosylamino)methylideneamino]imidazole-4-carboxamide isomerase [Spirochaetaceae bacterium]